MSATAGRVWVWIQSCSSYFFDIASVINQLFKRRSADVHHSISATSAYPQIKACSSQSIKVRNYFIPSIINTELLFRMANGTQSAVVKTVAQRNNIRQAPAVLFGRVIVLRGSFIGLADNWEKNMVNEYALSTLYWFFLFAFCLMAPEISHYFFPGAFQKMLPHTAVLHTL